jgi:hypothetical protein
MEYLPITTGIIPLDNAILNHSLRSRYLESLSGLRMNHFQIQQDFFQPSDSFSKGVDWMINRNVHSLEISIQNCPLHENYSQLIERSRPLIRSISFQGSRELIHSIFLQGTFPLLRTLCIPFCSVCPIHFVVFLLTNPQLESLDIAGMENSSVDILPIISEICPHLTSLNLSQIPWVTDECIPQLVKGFPKLCNLNIDCARITQPSSIVTLLNSFPLLKSLSISSWRLPLDAIKYYILEYADPRLDSDDLELQGAGCRAYASVASVL